MINQSSDKRTIALLRIPIPVWLLAVVGGAVGIALAEPGDFWGNTVPSAATFFVLAFIVGLVGWAATRRLRG